MINDRIAALIESLGISPNRFSEKVKVNPTVIHNIIKARRSKPSFDLLEKILTTYEEISSDWLLRGEGGIWRKKTSLLRRASSDPESIEKRILELTDNLRSKAPEHHEVYELNELVAALIDEHDAQNKKMHKTFQRQEEIIQTLMRLKKNL